MYEVDSTRHDDDGSNKSRVIKWALSLPAGSDAIELEGNTRVDCLFGRGTLTCSNKETSSVVVGLSTLRCGIVVDMIDEIKRVIRMLCKLLTYLFTK